MEGRDRAEKNNRNGGFTEEGREQALFVELLWLSTVLVTLVILLYSSKQSAELKGIWT